MDITTAPVTLLILTHGRAGEELIHSAEMILGPATDVLTVPLLPADGLEDYIVKVREALLRVADRPVLVLVDLHGGTPSNCAAMLSREFPFAALSGVNLAMVIEAMTLRTTMDLAQLSDVIRDSGRDSIRDILQGLA